MTALLLTLAVIVLILLRIPVAYALLAPSMFYLAFLSPVPLNISVQQMVQSVNGFVLLAVPLFILLGNLSNATGIGDVMYTAAQNVIGRVRGGLAYVNIATSLGFSWMSGTALSDVAVLGSIQVPQMIKYKYPRRLVAGITAASSLVTPIMPPSVPAIIIGVTAGVSIGGLFAASVVPALVMVVALAIWVFLATRKNPDLEAVKPPPGETLRSAVKSAPIMVTPVIVLGGILGGFVTPTEAAAIALVYLTFCAAVFYRKLNWAVIWETLTASGRTIGTLFILVAGAGLFAWILTVEEVPRILADFLTGHVSSPTVFLFLVVAFMLVLGMVMEPGSAILISIPVLAPIAAAYDIPPLQFAVVSLFTLMIGLLTPPVGLVLFVLESVTDLKMPEIIRGTLPFVALFGILAILLVLVPQLTLWLPSLLGN